jgi:hypothetical protein
MFALAAECSRRADSFLTDPALFPRNPPVARVPMIDRVAVMLGALEEQSALAPGEAIAQPYSARALLLEGVFVVQFR